MLRLTLRYTCNRFPVRNLLRAENIWSFKLKRNFLTCRVHCNEVKAVRRLQVLTEDQKRQVSVDLKTGQGIKNMRLKKECIASFLSNALKMHSSSLLLSAFSYCSLEQGGLRNKCRCCFVLGLPLSSFCSKRPVA